MRLTFLGTGTSFGVPVIGCGCGTCASEDGRDKRTRSSVLVTARNSDGSKASALVDVGPEFRIQALRAGIARLDAVLLTHSHADHLHGIDDLRVFSHTKPSDQGGEETSGAGLPVYANPRTARDIRGRFDYIFTPTREGGGKPKIRLIETEGFSARNPIIIGAMKVIPVPLLHGTLEDTGYLFTEEAEGGSRSIAYLSDCSSIPQDSIELLREFGGSRGIIEHCVIDALRKTPHDTHLSFDQALGYAAKIGARHTWLVHIGHEMRHAEIEAYVRQKWNCENSSVAPAYDGLEISTEGQ